MRCHVETIVATSGPAPTLIAMRRLRPLSEAECYTRLYGNGDETVRVLRLRTLQLRREQRRLTGDQIRKLFEGRLETREEAEAA